MKFGEAVCERLAEYGVDTVFGIPGVHTIELFRNLGDHGLKVIVPRHEQGAGFMAAGSARITGQPGVCFLVTGPGVLNALTPIAQAWHDSQPMLIIASTVETSQFGKHRGTLHDTPDVAETLRPYTLLSRNVSTIEEFDASLEEAYSLWETDRPRPVFIGIPVDVLASEVPARKPLTRERPTPKQPTTAQVASVGALLKRADEPVIIAGGGCSEYGDELLRLAEALDSPVLLTGNSKGLLPDRHPLNLQLSAPFVATQTLLENADAVLAIGTELSSVEYIFTGSEPVKLQNISRIDLDPSVSHPDQHAPTIESDAGAFINALLPMLNDPGNEHRPVSGAARTATATGDWKMAKEADPYRDWLTALNQNLPDNAIVTADSAQLAYQAHQFLPIAAETTWISPYGLGTLGPALPMAIGAAAAAPARPVIALAGDGSSLFTIAELATAVDLDRQLTVIIWVNGGYKEIEDSFARAAIPAVGVETSAPDFSSIVRGLGGEPVSVRHPDELAEALAKAVLTPQLTVILIHAPEPLRISTLR